MVKNYHGSRRVTTAASAAASGACVQISPVSSASNAFTQMRAAALGATVTPQATTPQKAPRARPLRPPPLIKTIVGVRRLTLLDHAIAVHRRGGIYL
eukprot:2537854-Pleurochrysis_carterae.AAC.2